MSRLVFFSLQGLGDSILDFPILLNLRERNDVEVITFNNGSSAFYRAYHDSVTEVCSVQNLIARTLKTRADSSFACFPSWRREIASSLLVRASRKYMMRPLERRWLKMFFANQPLATPAAHHVEENVTLLQHALGATDISLDIRSKVGLKSSALTDKKILAVHPTASTPFKYYPREFWVELLKTLRDDFDEIHMFCGGAKAEVDFCKSIAEACGPKLKDRIQLYSNLNFAILTQKLSDATCFVGSDSSLMHLSALLDVPLVALWSFANYKVMYPYGNASAVYVPEETLNSRIHEYPSTNLPYLRRSSAADVSKIVRKEREVDFQIKPKFKSVVNFHVY